MAETRKISFRKQPEPAVRVLLLIGMVLNALVLLRGEALSPSDLLLGGTVLAAGAALLILMGLSRRTTFRRRG